MTRPCIDALEISFTFFILFDSFPNLILKHASLCLDWAISFPETYCNSKSHDESYVIYWKE